MVQNVAPRMRDLEAGDFYLLSGVEHGMRFSDWVNRKKLPDLTGLDPEDVSYRLDRCLRFDLIERRTIQYEGYRLKFEGYDVLALHTLAERGSVDEVGAPLGVGKESDVLEVRGAETYALKFHREGITNFREVHREREYTADREHVSWMYTARKAAEREYEVLCDLDAQVSVPEPIDHNRHAVVMERLDGRELAEVRLDDTEAQAILVSILVNVGRAHQVGYINADLSAYNVFVAEDAIHLIDWPQAVDVDHENAEELLRRDIENVVNYFQRKHPHGFPNSVDYSRLIPLVKQISREKIIELIS